ncbi:MAG: hypothetical protein ACLFP1_03040, partial [Candidatus Goldiibacteriota bacterium]
VQSSRFKVQGSKQTTKTETTRAETGGCQTIFFSIVFFITSYIFAKHPSRQTSKLPIGTWNSYPVILPTFC